MKLPVTYHKLKKIIKLHHISTSKVVITLFEVYFNAVKSLNNNILIMNKFVYVVFCFQLTAL